PSGHNSQPWQFRLEQNKIYLAINKARDLPYSDPKSRQAMISLGCALFNLLTAARHYQFNCKIESLPEIPEDPICISVQQETRPIISSNNNLISAILTRRTNRFPYKPELPPPYFLNKISQLSESDCQIKLISDKPIKEKLADIMLKAGIAALDDPLFRQELSQYIKNSYTRSPVGITGFALGLPGPISLLAPFLIKRLNMSKASLKQDEKLLKEQTPVIAIIAAKNDNPLSWLKTGQIYQHISLLAAQEKIATSMQAAAVQNENFSQQVQQLLNTDFKPMAIFRLGYWITDVNHTPRLNVEQVITK
ncbi:MAG: nitroreductase family protein, partial [Parcubacteria group bacterium]|nr:nitroreductase family protein [Parcubacteria group bacterium]